MNTAGGIFHMLEFVLDDVAESRGLVEKTEVEQLISELKEMLENGKPAGAEEADPALTLERVDRILDAACVAANSNEVLMKVMEETGSTMFAQILSGDLSEETLMKSDEEFIAGIRKEVETMQEFLAGIDSRGKHRAQGILKLTHDLLEDVWKALLP